MRALDVSQWQGTINWPNVPTEIIIMKMSGGDAGLYTDSKANQNYYGAKANGKALGMYHFAGGGNPENEADFFIAACSPLEENDVMVLDWEIQHPDPVGWCSRFIQRVIDRTGVRPLIYMNTSTENAHNWTPVVNQNIGLWIADYRMGPGANVPIHHWPTYVMHQYTSNGTEPGIAGRVDVNEWFGTKAQFQKYGYHKPVEPTPPPQPEPAPIPPPQPVPEPEPVPTPNPDPTPPPAPDEPIPSEPTPPEPTPEPPTNAIKKLILAVGTAIAALVVALLAWLNS